MRNFSDEDLLRIARLGPTPREIGMILNDRSFEKLCSKEIGRRYADKWVAAYNGDIIGTADDQESLLEIIRSKAIPPSIASVRYIYSSAD